MLKKFDICIDYQEFLIKYLCSFYVLESMNNTALYNELLKMGREIIMHNKDLINEIEKNCVLDFKSNNAIVSLAMTLCNYMIEQDVEELTFYK